ncbi:MAG: GAF domain-containing protein [Prochloraceae cyanobacterium]|nr:GAF domain-containing protein [Prochloraceae cyanobacterium]
MKTKQQTRPDRTTKLKQELKKPTTAPNKSRPEPKESAQLLPTKKSNLKINAITVAIVLGILPAAAVGTATSFFSQQLLQADNSRATQTQIESLQTKQQEVLLMGALATTTVAAIAGIFAALWANRTIERATKEARAAAAEKYREERADRSHLLTDSINSIRASFKREEVLQATVEETRRALGADRVVVYSLDKYSQGTVIAESVDANFSISLGVKFDDPCFTAQYLEKYQNGRVQAIDNIYEADLSSCYINQLKEFQVKANLIAPLMNQGKLIGLLIAHQCSTARRWQQSEIDLFVQLAAQAGFALDNAELLEEYDNLAKQVDAEIKWKDYLTDATKHLYEHLDFEEVLKAGVEEGRRVLGCDRVVIYSVDRQSQGIIIAESVGPGWVRTLGRKIEDPCFEAKYIAQYENGRVRAWNNIHEAGMTSCYVEQLEKIAVKANLVAPVVHEGKLLGIIAAHQCSEPRDWQDLEITWFKQLGIQVGFALDNAKLMTQVEQMSREVEQKAQKHQQEKQTIIKWKDYLTEATKYLYENLDFEEVLKAGVEEARRVLGCDRVVIYSVDRQSQGIIIAESVGAGWVRILGRKIEDPCFEAKYIAQYENGRVRAWNNIYEAGMTSCYVEQLEKIAVKANLVAPVVHEGKLLGIIAAHQCSGPREWQELEITWLKQLGIQVGFALDNAKLMGRFNQVEKEVQKQQQEKETIIKWKDYLIEATKHLYEHLDFEEVLKAGVEEARRVIGCDRVVIYSVDRQSQGIIIAESVGPGWVRTLGRKIEDPCFEAKYIAQYENGRVRAWNNIHEAGMTSCYIEQLEKIAVKANLVAPVVHEGKLLGIIAAHQCSGPREWQDLEITWLKQLGIQVGFALDNAKLMTQVERMSREAETTALKQRQQIEALQRQVEKILSDSQKAISNFSDDTQRQTDYVTAVLEQIQALADSARSTIAQAQQIEKQLKQTSQAVEAGHENIDLTVDRLNMILEDFTEAKDKMKHLGDSSQGISQVINLIEDLASQMNQEAINVTIEAGRKEDHEGEYVASLAETLRFCSQQLATATSQMQPEISQIETQTSQLASAMETKIDDILKEAELVKETRQKLNQVATINFQINALVEKISLSAIDQVETSVTARKSIMEAANLATKSSEQFAIVNESCKKLAEVTQEL